MDPLIATSINGLGQMASTAIGAAGNSKVQKMVNEANFKMAQWQNATNVQNWQMQNYYNSPAQQMQRLKDAGLNPNLVYGNGAVGNSASAPHSVSAPRMEGYQFPTHFFDGLGRIVEGIMASSQIRKTEAEIQNIRANTNLTSANSNNARMDYCIKQFALARTSMERDYWRDQVETNLRLQRAQAGNMESMTQFRNDYESAIADSQIGLNNARYVSEIYNQELQPYRIQEIQARVSSVLGELDLKRQLQPWQIRSIAYEIAERSSRSKGNLQENEIRQILLDNGLNIKEGGLYGGIQKILNGLGKAISNSLPRYK